MNNPKELSNGRRDILKFEVVESIKTMTSISTDLKKYGYIIKLIPTMGALHDGHAALIKQATKEIKSDQDRSRIKVVVSIFVNPLQFNNPDDLKKYPVNWSRDIQLCEQLDVDLIFAPQITDLYPDTTDINQLCHIVPYPKYANGMEGKSRPGHFAGMLTVVNKLLNIVQPSEAFFGEKDYQQLILVQKMIVDFNINTVITPVKTVRSEDGLPLSSRNIRLSSCDRKLAAMVLYTMEKNVTDILTNLDKNSQYFKLLSKRGFIYFEEKELLRTTDVKYPELCNEGILEAASSVDYIEIRCKKHFDAVKYCETRKFFDCENNCIESNNSGSGNEIILVRFLTAITVNNVRLLDNIEIELVQ